MKTLRGTVFLKSIGAKRDELRIEKLEGLLLLTLSMVKGENGRAVEMCKEKRKGEASSSLFLPVNPRSVLISLVTQIERGKTLLVCYDIYIYIYVTGFARVFLHRS